MATVIRSLGITGISGYPHMYAIGASRAMSKHSVTMVHGLSSKGLKS